MIASKKQTYSLSELLGHLESFLNNKFHQRYFYVRAELMNVRGSHQGRYTYAQLVEKDPHSHAVQAEMKGVAWREGTQSIRAFERTTGQKFTDGMEVLLLVSITFSKRYGLSFLIHEVDAEYTLGKMAMQREQTLKLLVAKNPDVIRLIQGEYFTRNKALTLPEVPQRIALLTSAGSDAEKDFMQEIMFNEQSYRFKIRSFAVQVQGKNAPQQLIAALEKVEQDKSALDAVVIVRGGGSKSDLLAFDNYDLALKCAAFPLPIITGIGHENDNSVCDFMVAASTKTPTRAAVYLLDHFRAYESALDVLMQSILDCSRDIINTEANALKDRSHYLKDRAIGLINSEANLMARQVQLLKASSDARLNVETQHLAHSSHELRSASFRLLFKEEEQLGALWQAMGYGARQITDQEQRLWTKLPQMWQLQLMSWMEKEDNHLERKALQMDYLSPENVLKRGYAIIENKDGITTDFDNITVGEKLRIRTAHTAIDTTVDQKEKRKWNK